MPPATRVRLEDMLPIASKLDQVGFWSLESWGGATFDACIRYLGEDPWERIRRLKEAMPNTPQQMLFRGQNILGYRHYADDVVEAFVERAALNGVDVFRVFDALNWIPNMKVAMEAVVESGAICEASICYTGDILNPGRTKYDLNYYVNMAKELKAAGTHILGLKDMGGLVKPAAARVLVKALKEETGLPIHFHHPYDNWHKSSRTVFCPVDMGCLYKNRLI